MISCSIVTLRKNNSESFITFLLNNLSRLLKIQGLKYIFGLVESKNTELFTSYRDYLLNSKL